MYKEGSNFIISEWISNCASIITLQKPFLTHCSTVPLSSTRFSWKQPQGKGSVGFAWALQVTVVQDRVSKTGKQRKPIQRCVIEWVTGIGHWSSYLFSSLMKCNPEHSGNKRKKDFLLIPPLTRVEGWLHGC